MRIGSSAGDAASAARDEPRSLRQIASLAAILAATAAASWFLTPVIGRPVFGVLYVGVAASAAAAGTKGGVAALLADLLILRFIVLPRSQLASSETARDVFPLITFVTVSALLVALIRSMRRVRRRVGIANRDLEIANRELERANARLAEALGEANHARENAVEQADRLRLLDQVSGVLGSSLDYEATVAATARLAVPTFADWCSVDVLVDGEIKQLGAAHIDTPAFHLLSEVRQRTTLSADQSTALAQVIRTGVPRFNPKVEDSQLPDQARSSEHLAVLREVGIRSIMLVPMIARGHIIGALTVARTRPDRPFDDGAFALAREVAARAALAIDNAQLYKTAIAANEAKSTFLATMSHELRTPLTAIIGYEALLVEGVEGDVNDAQRHHLDRIKASARQLLALIEEVLLYARVEAGVESVRVDEVRAKSVVEEALTVVAPLAQAEHLSLVVNDIDPNLVLQTDGGKLRQMLVNLLANAVKFTERGEHHHPCVRGRARRRLRGSGYGHRHRAGAP